MKKMLIIASILVSMMFMQINHPLAMGLILLMQTVIMCLISGLMVQTFWFSYVLFLIFLGGMLVLFIYVTSLASNEMFNLSTKMMMTSMVLTTFMTTMMMSMPQNNMDLTNQEMIMNNENILLLMKLYNGSSSLITILLASYLFLTLIAVVKITNISKGPLRQMY
uniref:NADH-ubiquinone oxidoreductase chain 6 n=2 Tax=Eupolyphaga sinensis TaxID=367774 RepID=D8L5C4_9NEOP|nr:NADH dehydrogenase subunit 6 [Eupolyphaga sinensis]ACO07087.1 NADH dehydrogenase subunit 6 [Eupolyphaga sinensis]